MNIRQIPVICHVLRADDDLHEIRDDRGDEEDENRPPVLFDEPPDGSPRGPPAQNLWNKPTDPNAFVLICELVRL